MAESFSINCPQCNSHLPVGEKLMATASKIKCGGCGAVINPAQERVKQGASGGTEAHGGYDFNEFDEGTRAASRAMHRPGGGSIPGSGRAYFLPAAALLIVLLGGQLLWVNKSSWGQRASFQPVYEFICPRFPGFCSLSEMVEAEVQIHGLERAMGDIPGSVLVSGSLINHSTEPRAFPQLFVRFTNLDGQVVASGVFEASNYLAVPVTSNLMRTNQPYKFQLNIASSGRESLSPTLNFQARLLRSI